MNTKTSSQLILAGSVLFVTFFVFFLYTFLHEAGHTLIGLLFGQSITDFNVNFWNFGAHVSMVGGELTEAQFAIQAVAGASLPLFIWLIFISMVPRKTGFTLEALKLISSMAVLNTLLAWILLPILFIIGKAPADDVTHFLRYSQMPPLLLGFVASCLYAGGWTLFLSKIDGLRNEFRLFRTTDRQTLTAGTRQIIPVMASLIIFCIVLVTLFNISAEKNSLSKFSPPQGFTPVAQVDLSKQAYSSKTLTQFTLDKPTYVGVFIAIRNIDTTYFDLSVTGPNGFNSIVLHGEGYNAFQDGGLWEENLSVGTYQLVLTSHQSPGTASIHLKIH